MMERRGFLAILAMALGLPKALGARLLRRPRILPQRPTPDYAEWRPPPFGPADIERATRDFRAWQREAGMLHDLEDALKRSID